MLKITSVLKNLYSGLITVFTHLFKKPVTEEYPEIRPELNENFRGKHSLNDKCIGCGMCKSVCPADAISLKKDENNKLISYKIDYGKCIFCGNCVYYCPQKAIKHTNEFELAVSADCKQNLEVNLKQKGTEESDD